MIPINLCVTFTTKLIGTVSKAVILMRQYIALHQCSPGRNPSQKATLVSASRTPISHLISKRALLKSLSLLLLQTHGKTGSRVLTTPTVKLEEIGGLKNAVTQCDTNPFTNSNEFKFTAEVGRENSNSSCCMRKIKLQKSPDEQPCDMITSCSGCSVFY